MADELLTTEELAERWKISVWTLIEWRRDRNSSKLPYVKIGRAVRYRLSDVEEMEARGGDK